MINLNERIGQGWAGIEPVIPGSASDIYTDCATGPVIKVVIFTSETIWYLQHLICTSEK